ncbi:MAG: NIPSNAP family protein [Alphaproteobacteria bacterium]
MRQDQSCFVGHYHSEVGTQSQLVMMWAFDAFNQRMDRKAKLDANPAWSRELRRSTRSC